MTIFDNSTPTLFDETELPRTSSAAGSRARTCLSLADALASKVKDLVCGESTGDLLANYDPDSSSWRTCQACLVSEWEPFSETWPRSGTMQHGTAYQLQPSAPLTGGIESGLLPTPRSCSAMAANITENTARAKHPNLETILAREMWPTPVARDCRTIKGAQRAPNATGTEPLTVVVGQMENTTVGALNPPWVEWLMGFPLGWTDLEPSATQSSPKSQSLLEEQS